MVTETWVAVSGLPAAGGVQPLTAGVEQQQPDARMGGQCAVQRLQVSQVRRAGRRGALQLLGEVAAVVVVLAGREGLPAGMPGWLPMPGSR